MTAPELPEWMGFALSSASPAVACILSNPLEVAKVRKQMDGELRSTNSGIYRGPFQTIAQIYRVEGLKSVQAGLSVAIFREASKNLFRLGLFLPILTRIHDSADGPAPIYKRMCAGALSGSIAAFICNPIEIVKTRIQAESTGANAQATGRVQFGYRGVGHAISCMWKTEGISGMWRHSVVSMWRSALVTSTNMTAYTSCKELGVRSGFTDGAPLHVASSATSAFFAVLAGNPLDVIRNRLYNQNAKLYSGSLDAIAKIYRTEGLLAFNKGFWAHYLRSGPHFVLTFVIFEQLKQGLLRRQWGKEHMK